MPNEPPAADVRPRQVIRGLERASFGLIRIKGSHHYLVHPDRPELLVWVPAHPGDLQRPVLRSIVRQADLTVDAFLALL